VTVHKAIQAMEQAHFTIFTQTEKRAKQL